MKKQTILILLVVGMLSAWSCTEKNTPKKGSIRLTFNHNWTINPLEYNKIQYTNAANNTLSIEKIKYFITNIRLQKLSGEYITSPSRGLIDTENGKISFLVNDLPLGSYQKIEFVLGVDPENNHKDPNTFGASDPLNVVNHGDMHWDWNPGYIFLKVEGKYYKSSGQTSTYFYHIGLDQYALVNAFEAKIQVTEGNQNNAVFEVKLSKFFNSPNVWDIETREFTNTVGDAVVPPILFGNMKNMITLKKVE